MSKDYYSILGVDKGASQEEIKKDFRTQAHKYHPDKKDGNEQKFKDANEAYQVLGDATKRQQYDQFGSGFENMSGGFGGASGFNWSDFASQGGGGFADMGDIFGDFFGGSRSSAPRKQRGADIEVNITIEFKDAAFGAKKELELYKHVTCSVCAGNGAQPGSKMNTCETCKGVGQVTQVRRTMLGNIQTQSVCPDCEGKGQKPENVCKDCHGSGIIKDKEIIEISIPAGVDNGVTLRVSGKGEAAPHQGVSGDLYVHIRVRADEIFTREGANVLSTVHIPFTMATLGGKIDIETLDGPVTLKIPEGTQSGHVFKLKGKGAQNFQQSSRADHLVTVKVDVPKKLSREQKKILKDLEDLGL